MKSPSVFSRTGEEVKSFGVRAGVQFRPFFLSAPKRVQCSGRHVISGPRFEFPCITIGFEAGMGRGGCCAWLAGEVFGYEVERHRVHWHRFGHPALLSGMLRRVLWH
jgi:hypothetical protein